MTYSECECVCVGFMSVHFNLFPRHVAASSALFLSGSILMRWSVFLRMVRICQQTLLLLLEHVTMDRSQSLELTSRKKWRKTKSSLLVSTALLFQ